MSDSADPTDASLDETTVIARDLIRFDTSNYGDGKAEPEREAAEYVAAKLRDLGLEPELIDSDPGRTSVVARVAGEDRERGALVVHGHLDVVPAIADAWSVDPFGGVVKDGMLWGRGAVDMKNMDAMILASLGDILREGRRPSRDLVVAFFADEEAGGVRGSAHVVRTRPELFAGATEAISEVGGYSVELAGKRAYLVQTGEKALMWLTLRAHGTAGHGSQINPENAVTRLAEAIARIGSETWPTRLTDTTRALLSEVARLLGYDPQRSTPEELALATGTASRFVAATLQTTANPSMLSAGYKANVIPGTAEATIDVRVLPGEEDAVLERLRVLAGEHVEILVQHRDIGLEVPFAGPLVESMAASLRRFDPDAEVLPYLLSGGTDNKALSTLGITGYGFAPLQLPPSLDFPALFHGVDERVPLDALVFGRKVLTDLLLRS
ncbi:M20/M25/M40 family metallo-hydrolase [Rathayibacter iranicus]|uniref:Peptidase M20 dimerisation domain-containing protein n=2 Tax=Rathayibacter iranicus TaxID=59737 RepID=A0AAD1AEJ4_9MICO|nr:M20/M25/M40 family metallo-hydrolase [Rathayibacter iranicus]AZZ55209.1 hypothetical protein C7V51_04370 [Rathayibacter iranicus]MWV31552.1 M20/M25/M40 family metallo-hydrolase [Rathayibacter iranicus NCPPB 2253 = VKM Ac-1602]PPI49342.1 hypothetical protein C5E09_03440 [Rathayibacter iranicus]PPI61600.1 hypothetical protein C5E08_04355 [Rathayibacter iranicus]PPI72088.1 hypothetical protein C5E01_06275 [Rathayibacter iranicus]